MNDTIKVALISGSFTIFGICASYFLVDRYKVKQIETDIQVKMEELKNEITKSKVDIRKMEADIIKSNSETKKLNYDLKDRVNDRMLNLIQDNSYIPNIKFNYCNRINNSYVEFNNKKYEVIVCNFTNSGKFLVHIWDINKNNMVNIKDVILSPDNRQNAKWTTNSSLDVKFYVQFYSKQSSGQLQIQFKTDIDMMKKIQEIYDTKSMKIPINDSILYSVKF